MQTFLSLNFQNRPSIPDIDALQMLQFCIVQNLNPEWQSRYIENTKWSTKATQKLVGYKTSLCNNHYYVKNFVNPCIKLFSWPFQGICISRCRLNWKRNFKYPSRRGYFSAWLYAGLGMFNSINKFSWEYLDICNLFNWRELGIK